MPALDYSFHAGDIVYINHIMPYGASSERWRIVSQDACHYYVQALFTPGPMFRVRFDSVRSI